MRIDRFFFGWENDVIIKHISAIKYLSGECMTAPSDNETWIIERGDVVIQKEARSGLASLTPWERLLYCLWVADYGMRNAGDLHVAHDVYADFLLEGRRSASTISLPLSRSAFSLSPCDFEREYFQRFESICDEIRSAEPVS
jgi:hypothetical protein